MVLCSLSGMLRKACSMFTSPWGYVPTIEARTSTDQRIVGGLTPPHVASPTYSDGVSAQTMNAILASLGAPRACEGCYGYGGSPWAMAVGWSSCSATSQSSKSHVSE
eukprot:512668-Amphidinium_carterae.1